MRLAHAQPIKIVYQGLVATEVDFLARALERMLHAIAVTQNIPRLGSAQVSMSDFGCGTVEISTDSRLHAL